MAKTIILVLAAFFVIGGIVYIVANTDFLSQADSFIKEQTKDDSLSGEKLIALERNFQKLAQDLNYVSTVGNKWYRDTNDNLRYSSHSSFIISYKGRVFLLTAGHVASIIHPSDPLYFYSGGNFYNLSSSFVLGSAVDLAAVEVTGLFTVKNAGILKLDNSDLKRSQPLMVICNPAKFSGQLLGFFSGYKNSGSGFSWLVTRFPGATPVPGCSGSPLIDEQGAVRGLIVAGSGYLYSNSMETGYAVPADIISSFLDKSFFSF